MANKKNISEVLYQLIAEVREEEVQPIKETEFLDKDLEIDSMGFLFLTVSIEREFSIKITPEDWRGIQTFGELVAFIEERFH